MPSNLISSINKSTNFPLILFYSASAIKSIQVLEFLKVPNIKQMPEVPIIVDLEQSKTRLSKEITLLSLAQLCFALFKELNGARISKNCGAEQSKVLNVARISPRNKT